MRIGTKVSKVIRRMTAMTAQETESSAFRDAARATGALPVHADTGGALAITVDGEVIMYDFETGETTIPEQKWKVLAHVKAARRYPELRELAPRKPADAKNCPSCAGSGILLENADCEMCLGTGWRIQTK
jgi:hypothetical protein